ncbi:MAG TPA: hypothetical protein PKV83_02895, partial [Methanothrix sp.]|nr:hypothetical protein [Methanothrix sp.]
MSLHQKRLTIPVSWPVARKTSVWVPKSSPGPHSAMESIPLLVVIRDMLKLVDDAREAIEDGTYFEYRDEFLRRYYAKKEAQLKAQEEAEARKAAKEA